MGTRAKRFIQLPNKQKSLFLESAYYLVIYSIALKIMPFRFVKKLASKRKAPREKISSSALAQIRWGLQAAGKALPGKYKCLARALAAKRILDRRCISNTLRLGLAKDKNGALQAHAWLSSGDNIVVGRGEADRFTEIASYT